MKFRIFLFILKWTCLDLTPQLSLFQSLPWLCLWIGLGAILRFWDLGALPPWTDECATAVFSLGKGFLQVPLDQLINGDALLEPLRWEPSASIAQVPQRLLSESTHPPVYFALTHLWMHLWVGLGNLIGIKIGYQGSDLVSMTGARSLSALLGVLSIPAGFSLSWITLRSSRAALMTAALMALSPLNVAWAREARHYSFVLLLVMLSLGCFVRAMQTLYRRKALPRSTALVWILANALGVATHYFFVLVLAAQALVLLRSAEAWHRFYKVVLATIVATIIWLPVLQQIRSNSATDWVSGGDWLERWLLPPVNLLLWNVSAVTQLPAATTVGLPIAVIVLSAVAMLAYVTWLVLQLRHANRQSEKQPKPNRPEPRVGRNALVAYGVISLLLLMGLTYGLGVDVTRAPRFGFAYYAAGMVWLGGLLVAIRDRKMLGVIGTIAFLGSIVVIANGSYLQHHRPDLIANLIQSSQSSSEPIPVIIATTHRHHGHTGRLMGIEWSLRQRHYQERYQEQHQNPQQALTQEVLMQEPVQYFLAHREPEGSYEAAIAHLNQQLSELPRPFDIWLLNLRSSYSPDQTLGCSREPDYRGHLGEYRHKLYRCR